VVIRVTMKHVGAVVRDLDARDLLSVVDDVCRRRGVPRNDLCGRTRTQSVSHARQEIWWRLRHDPERHYSLLEIARLFGRDHATVLAGVAAHNRRAATSSPGDPA
jgi:chromosomal replication initiation ATPase DnaA